MLTYLKKPIIIDDIHCGYLEIPPGGFQDSELVLFGRIALEQSIQNLCHHKSLLPQDAIVALSNAITLLALGVKNDDVSVKIIIAYLSHNLVIQRAMKAKSQDEIDAAWLPYA